MSKFFPFLFAFLFVSATCNEGSHTSVETDNSSTNSYSESGIPSDGIFHVKSGKMVSNFSGMQSGTETWWWDDFGKLQRKETNTVIEYAGIKQETNQINIFIGDDSYVIDPKNKTAKKIKNDMMSGMSGQQKQDFGYAFMEEMGGQIIGTEKVLNKTCEIWQIDSIFQAKTWIWKTIPLRSEVNMMGMSQNSEATSLELDIKVDEALFSLDGYDVQDLGSVQDYLGR